MAKKITLKEIGDMLTHVIKHMGTKDDIADLKIELKGDIARVQEQVNSIEAELKYGRYESGRVINPSAISCNVPPSEIPCFASEMIMPARRKRAEGFKFLR